MNYNSDLPNKAKNIQAMKMVLQMLYYMTPLKNMMIDKITKKDGSIKGAVIRSIFHNFEDTVENVNEYVELAYDADIPLDARATLNYCYSNIMRHVIWPLVGVSIIGGMHEGIKIEFAGNDTDFSKLWVLKKKFSDLSYKDERKTIDMIASSVFYPMAFYRFDSTSKVIYPDQYTISKEVLIDVHYHPNNAVPYLAKSDRVMQLYAVFNYNAVAKMLYICLRGKWDGAETYSWKALIDGVYVNIPNETVRGHNAFGLIYVENDYFSTFEWKTLEKTSTFIKARPTVKEYQVMNHFRSYDEEETYLLKLAPESKTSFKLLKV